jgi:hypothetical protein
LYRYIEGKLRSRLTLIMYLSEGFLGGATTFYTVGGCTC